MVNRTNLDVRMTRIGGAKLPGASLLFSVFVELWFVEDGPGLTLIGEVHCKAAGQSLLVLATKSILHFGQSKFPFFALGFMV